jgi:dihydroneopterin aldolase
MDRIKLVNMTFYGHHGVYEAERELGKPVSFDVELCLDLRPAGESDDLNQTVDYAAVYALIKETEESKQYYLLEALAEAVAARILHSYPQVREVVVRARKQEAPVGGLIQHVEVEITRARSPK